jgi:hypothetical protein
MSTWDPCSSPIPSAPTAVVTTGRARAIASPILPFIPAPHRIGAIDTRQELYSGSRSCTQPVTWISRSASARARTLASGSGPTTNSGTTPRASWTRGRISRTNQTMASPLAAKGKLPTKSSPPRSPKGRPAAEPAVRGGWHLFRWIGQVEDLLAAVEHGGQVVPLEGGQTTEPPRQGRHRQAALPGEEVVDLLRPHPVVGGGLGARLEDHEGSPPLQGPAGPPQHAELAPLDVHLDQVDGLLRGHQVVEALDAHRQGADLSAPWSLAWASPGGGPGTSPVDRPGPGGAAGAPPR